MLIPIVFFVYGFYAYFLHNLRFYSESGCLTTKGVQMAGVMLVTVSLNTRFSMDFRIVKNHSKKSSTLVTTPDDRTNSERIRALVQSF